MFIADKISQQVHGVMARTQAIISKIRVRTPTGALFLTVWCFWSHVHLKYTPTLFLLQTFKIAIKNIYIINSVNNLKTKESLIFESWLTKGSLYS